MKVLAPCAGRLMSLADVPDPVFAAEMVGPGLAIDPPPGPATVVSPIDGKLVKVHPHAFVVLATDGVGILVHLGIDTVNLDGEGFELVAVEGEMVRSGQPVVTWNPADVEAGGLSPVSPVIALDAESAAVDAIADGAVAAGDQLFHWR